MPDLVPENDLPNDAIASRRRAANHGAESPVVGLRRTSSRVPSGDLPDDWSAALSNVVPADDLAIAPQHPTVVPTDDVPGVDGMAATWAKHYGAKAAPDVMTPELGAMIDKAADKYGVPRRYARIIAGIESSGGRVTGSSSAGARGVYQLMPGTFKSLGGSNIDDVGQNVDAGNRYLAQLLKRYKGDQYKAAMAYNMGPSGLDKALSQGYSALPAETQEYAGKLYASLQATPSPQPTANAPETKIATSPSAHPQLAGIGGEQSVQAVRRVAGEHGMLDEAVRGAKIQAFDAARNGLSALDAVLGGPQRFVEGFLGGSTTNHDVLSPFRNIGEGFNTAFHPHNEQLQDAEMDKILTALHMPLSHGDDLKSKITRLIETFGAQTATDPLTYIPLLGEVKMGAKAVGLLDRVYEAARTAGVNLPHVKQFAEAGRAMTKTQLWQGVRGMTEFLHEVFGRRPELDPFLEDHAKGARLSIEQRHHSSEQAQAREDEALLKQHEDALRKARTYSELPDAIKQRQLQEPWRYGTREMRAQAEQLGYRPTPEDLSHFSHPTGDLNYNLRDEYITMLHPKTEAKWEDLPSMRTVTGGRYKDEFSGFERERNASGYIPEDKYDLIRGRLRRGRALVRQRAIDRDTLQYLTQHGGWKHDTPVDVTKLSTEPRKVLPDSPLRFVSRAQKTAISFNPLPHGLKNVGMLAFLHGGPEAFGKGLAYATKGLPEEQRRRLIDLGVNPEYVRDIEGPLKNLAEKVPALENLHALSENTLNRLELGYRQALLEQLDRRFGRGELGSRLEYMKAEILRKALGDYRNSSLFVSALDAIGGPFAAFHVGIVPAAVGRSLLRRPGYAEQVARGQNDVNDTLMHHSPSEFEFGGPVADFAKLAFNPEGYIGSTAALGPWPVLARLLNPEHPYTAGELESDVAQMLIPYAGMAESTGAAHALGLGGYGSAPGVSPVQAGIAQLLGAYYRRRPSARASRRFKRAERLAH